MKRTKRYLDTEVQDILKLAAVSADPSQGTGGRGRARKRKNRSGYEAPSGYSYDTIPGEGTGSGASQDPAAAGEPTPAERVREANIARNEARLLELELLPGVEPGGAGGEAAGAGGPAGGAAGDWLEAYQGPYLRAYEYSTAGTRSFPYLQVRAYLSRVPIGTLYL